MLKFCRRIAQAESGATAIEYGLIAALIAMVLVAAMTTIGGALSGHFMQVANNLQTPG